MIRTLRNRLILSHILPTLLIIPLMGFALVYVLENRFLLPVVYSTLEEEAIRLAEIVRVRPALWDDPTSAQGLLESAGPFLGGRATLLLPDGRLLASSDPADAALKGQKVELPHFNLVSQGQIVRLQNGPSASVFAPVLSTEGQLLGIVRLTTHVVTITDQIFQMRYLIGGVMLLGVIAGVIFAGVLAVQINRPVQKITRTIGNLARGDFQASLVVEGPDELRALADAVNTLIARLQSLEQARRHLLANLIHELGRPLGALHSAIQALRKGAVQDPLLTADLLAGMQGETTRLQHLLEDLAELYDQVLGTLELHRIALNLAEWLPAVLPPWQMAAKEKGVHWQTDFPVFPIFQADPDRLSQALGNLVSNAIKFTPPGGTITIRTGADTGKGWVEVADTGPGIPSDEVEKIFTPFFQGQQGRRIVQGMGLGLAIAQDILLAHGGQITVESQPGRGSCFRMMIPLQGSP